MSTPRGSVKRSSSSSLTDLISPSSKSSRRQAELGADGDGGDSTPLAVSADVNAPIRQRARDLFATIFAPSENAPTSASQSVASAEDDDDFFGDVHTMTAAEAAVALENALFSAFKADERAYRSKARSLHFNLKSNAMLLDLIVRGELTGQEVIDLPTKALVSAAAQKRQTDLEASLMRSRELKDEGELEGITSEQYVCPVCHCGSTSYRYHSGRRDIGKSETWGSKGEDVVAISVTCSKCKHTWMAELQ